MAFIALLALLLIGPKQLPEVARTLGRFLNDLKRSTNGLKADFQNQIKFDQDEIRRQIMSQPQNAKKQENKNSFTGDPSLTHAEEKIYQPESANASANDSISPKDNKS